MIYGTLPNLAGISLRSEGVGAPVPDELASVIANLERPHYILMECTRARDIDGNMAPEYKFVFDFPSSDKDYEAIWDDFSKANGMDPGDMAKEYMAKKLSEWRSKEVEVLSYDPPEDDPAKHDVRVELTLSDFQLEADPRTFRPVSRYAQDARRDRNRSAKRASKTDEYQNQLVTDVFRAVRPLLEEILDLAGQNRAPELHMPEPPQTGSPYPPAIPTLQSPSRMEERDKGFTERELSMGRMARPQRTVFAPIYIFGNEDARRERVNKMRAFLARVDTNRLTSLDRPSGGRRD